MFMTFDQSISDCVIFLISSFWVHFADFSTQSSGLHQRWTSHRLLLWVLDYILFFLAWILMSFDSPVARPFSLVACKTVLCLPESNAAVKPSQRNRHFLAISTMLELKWNWSRRSKPLKSLTPEPDLQTLNSPKKGNVALVTEHLYNVLSLRGMKLIPVRPR